MFQNILLAMFTLVMALLALSGAQALRSATPKPVPVAWHRCHRPGLEEDPRNEYEPIMSNEHRRGKRR